MSSPLVGSGLGTRYPHGLLTGFAAAHAATTAVRAYLDEVRRVDVQRVAGAGHDPERVFLLIRALARSVASQVSVATLARDATGSGAPMDQDTAHAYLDALRRLMVVEDQPAWAPHLRSRSRVRTSPKRHFVDPSLAVAALRATPERLLADLDLMGFLFENLVVRDLRIYAQAADAQVLHYRDNTGLEVNAIVEAADGRWAAFEIKLGAGMVERAAESLRRFAERVDTTRCGRPSVIGVIVGTGLGGGVIVNGRDVKGARGRTVRLGGDGRDDDCEGNQYVGWADASSQDLAVSDRWQRCL